MSVYSDIIDYLVSHFRTGMPEHAKKIVRQSIKQDSPPSAFILVSIYDGTYSRWTTQQSNLSLQVLVQAQSDEEARTLALEVYDFFGETYDLDLAAPVGKSGMSKLTISAVVPQSLPQPLGEVGNGRFRYSTNYLIVVGDAL